MKILAVIFMLLSGSVVFGQSAGEVALSKAIAFESAARTERYASELAWGDAMNKQAQGDTQGHLDALNRALDLSILAANHGIMAAEEFDNAYYGGIEQGRAQSDLMYSFSNDVGRLIDEILKKLIAGAKNIEESATGG